MVVVSAVAFVVGAVCLYYGARALRTGRAIRRLEAREDQSQTVGRRDERAETQATEPTPDRRDDVDFERGFVLLVLGLLSLLFGVLAL